MRVWCLVALALVVRAGARTGGDVDFSETTASPLHGGTPSLRSVRDRDETCATGNETEKLADHPAAPVEAPSPLPPPPS